MNNETLMNVLFKVSTTIHEMAHAIGQMHEQSRSDRDNHVTMLWSNIQGGRSNNNMAKTDTHDYNPYDYESVLQYSLTVHMYLLLYSSHIKMDYKQQKWFCIFYYCAIISNIFILYNRE